MKLVLTGAMTLLLVSCASPQQGNQNARLFVSLTGLQEIPGPGDPDGNGTVELRVSPGGGQVCWNLYARAIDPATAAHIHRGTAGAAGPPVVTFTTPDANGRSQGCATVDRELVREMSMAAQNFYVNVHTPSHPQGAIRGQLRGAPERPFRAQPLEGMRNAGPSGR